MTDTAITATLPPDEVMGQAVRMATLAQQEVPLLVCLSVADLPPDEAVPVLARALHRLRIARSRLAEAERDVEQALAEAMPAKGWHVPGVGNLDMRVGSIRKSWQNGPLAHKVVDVAIGKGDIAHPHDVADVIVALAGFSYWRVGSVKAGTGLLGMGIDPTEYCDTEPGRTTVTILPEGGQ